MTQDALTALLKQRRDRAIAIVLGVKERECDRDLSAASSQKLRKVVLDQFNEFYLFISDVLSSLDTGDVVLNEEYLRKIDMVHQDIAAVRLLLEKA